MPAVVGLHDVSRRIQPGQVVVIDCEANEVVIDPDDEVLARVAYHGGSRRSSALVSDVERHRVATTADGVRVRLEANIEFPDNLAAARQAGAEGIGLYRSEFLLAGGTGVTTTEDGQFEVYRRILEGMAPAPVTIRTLDIDEDRLAAWNAPRAVGTRGVVEGDCAGREGLRGLRLSLLRPELFQTQLRALLRAARYGELRIMFPFVSGVEQLREARHLLTDAAEEVRQRGERVPQVPVGMMIEIPAAAYTADLFAREVDFFAIGTNDLIQYCLAVDRSNERVSRLYEPLHPAILRMIVKVCRAAARHRIRVSLCGEMAADTTLLPLLVGLGLNEFSMAAGAIPAAKQVLGELRSGDLRALARRVLRLATVDDIERTLLATLGRLARARE